MTISCQLITHEGQPIDGVFVELNCMDFPEQHFSGLSDNLGMIDEWISVRDQKVQCVQCTPNMDGSHSQMRFLPNPFLAKRSQKLGTQFGYRSKRILTLSSTLTETCMRLSRTVLRMLRHHELARVV